jgi:hypothetical protein
VTDSILDSVKKVLGLDPSYTVFDADVILHINTMFSVVNQLGIGPDAGFMIVDNTATWDTFIHTSTDPRLNMVKSYVYLRVRMLFDPPSTSFVISAMNEQIRELEVRMSIKREGEAWTDPNPVPVPTPTPCWWVY